MAGRRQGLQEARGKKKAQLINQASDDGESYGLAKSVFEKLMRALKTQKNSEDILAKLKAGETVTFDRRMSHGEEACSAAIQDICYTIDSNPGAAKILEDLGVKATCDLSYRGKATLAIGAGYWGK